MQMQNAMGLASIFGPLLMIVGIWMLFYHENMVKVCASCKNTPSVQYLMGVIKLLVGLTILSQYNIWDWSLPLLVTLLGWVILIRGLMALFVPQLSMKMSVGDPGWLKIKGVVPLIWGFGLCWLAFWMQQQY
jgi:hypothetical protein